MRVYKLLFIAYLCACAAAAQDSFTASPAALLKSAGPADANNEYGVTILEDQVALELDGSNRVTERFRMVYRIDSADAVENWGSVGIHWSPWYQEKPTIRARVITPDGAQHDLDVKTLSDAPANDQRPETYDNERILSGPLPAVGVGAVVEEDEVLHDTQSFFTAGIARRFWFGRSLPVRHHKVLIEFPSTLPLKYHVVSGHDISEKKEDLQGKIRLVFEQSSAPAYDWNQSSLPPDVATVPYVVVSTAPSWTTVAAAYNDIVEKQLAGADFKAVAAKHIGGDRLQTITNLVAYLHSEIRYTGIEFDEANVVPRSPKETFLRKFGDCKDKAAALVALLRAANIPSYLALLSTGPGLDADEDSPGMGNFDHAIVYVPGTPDLWIDATAEFHRVGSLPYMDQGRKALVINPEFVGLRKTMELKSTDNLLVEHREFELAAEGKARIREISEPYGDIEAGYRESYGTGESKEDRESLEKYVRQEYLAEALTKYAHGNGADLGKPFGITLEAARANRGYTDPDTAVVAIRFDSLFSRFPAYLKQTAVPQERQDSIVEAKKPRTVDLMFQPFVTEWRYRIALPPGFRARALPPAKEQQIGPAVLSYSFEQRKDGTIAGVLRLDSVKGRYTPAEAEAVQKAYTNLINGDPLLLNFEEIGAAELAAGRVREGLAEERRVIAAHPKDAVVRSHLARALLSAGLGDVAREESVNAIKLDPNSAIAFRTQGWILQHDLIGRLRKKGFDYNGAIAAYRKALQLEPANIQARANLAILLEFDASGERYSPDARLDDAIAEYDAMAKIDEDSARSYDENRLYDLLYAHHFQEAADLAASLPQTQTTIAVALASIAATRGAAAAVEQAGKISRAPADRKPALKTAALALRNMRKYPAAAELLEVAADGDASAAELLGQAQVFRIAKHYEDLLDPNNPVSAVQKMFLAFVDPAFITPATVKELEFTVTNVSEDRKTEALLRSGGMVRQMFDRAGIPRKVAADLLISALKTSVEGEDRTGYRIRCQSIGAQTMTAFVGKTSTGYKIFGIDREVTGIGVEALRRLDADDASGAKQWLDWAREEITVPGGDDPISWPAFPKVYSRTDPADVDNLRRAALSLISDTEYSKPYLAEIRRMAAQAAAADSITAKAVEISALRASENWKDLQTVAASLFATYPQSDFAFDALSTACMHTKDWKTWESAIMKRLERTPDDATAIRSRARFFELQGKFVEARKVVKQLLDSGRATQSDMNAYGWDALFTDKVEPADLEVVQRGSSMSQNTSYAILHTLACLYAEVGRTKEARDLLLRTIDVGGLDEPDSSVWYGLGRIAEQYGETGSALRAYTHVELQTGEKDFPMSTYALAQNRKLRAEEGTARAPTAQ